MHTMSGSALAARREDRQLPREDSQLPLSTFKNSLRAWQAEFKARQALPKEVRLGQALQARGP
jgi:hypothetical protein